VIFDLFSPEFNQKSLIKNSLMQYLLVFAGGGVGSLLRYGIARGMSGYDLTFPYATLMANILSCIVLGFFVAWSLKDGMSDGMKLFFMVGLCGGFSTFSTFSNETFSLFETENYAYAFANILGSVILCLLAIYIGIKLGNWLISS